MPIGPGGERLPYPGDPGYMGNGPGPDIPPMGGPNDFLGGPAFDPRMTGATGQVEMGGQAERLNQLLEARQMIDQEIAAIVGGPPGTENLDMLPPPPMDPMMAQGMAPGGPPVPGGPPMPGGPQGPPMGPQGLLGM
jgi:hypothetical protein